MNLSVKNPVMNINANYTIQKSSFKGKILSPETFAAEPELLKKIQTLPNSIFLECSEFLKFCKSIDITPKISRAITKRLAEVRQTKANSKSFVV